MMSVADRLAILDAIARYSHTFDNREVDAFAQLFTEDGVFDMFSATATEPELVMPSRAAIHEWVTTWYRDLDPAIQSRHHQSGTMFKELTPESARTSTMLLTTAQHPGEASPRVKMTGVYHDHWRKTTYGWRIAHRTLRHDHREVLDE